MWLLRDMGLARGVRGGGAAVLGGGAGAWSPSPAPAGRLPIQVPGVPGLKTDRSEALRQGCRPVEFRTQALPQGCGPHVPCWERQRGSHGPAYTGA